MLRRLLSGLLVAALALGGVEAGLRLALGPPPPPVKVYAGLGGRASFLARTDAAVVPTFSEAARGRVIPLDETLPVVAFLGGSSVHGGSSLPVALEFPARVAERTGVLAASLADPGLDSFDLVRMAEELGELDAPLAAAVVYTGHNDFANTYYQARYGDLGAGLQARTRSVLEHLQLFCLLRLAVAPMTGREPDARAALDKVGWSPTPEQTALATRYLAANLRRVAWALDGVPLVVVIPASDDLRPPAGSRCPATPCALETWMAAEQQRWSKPDEARELYRAARDQDPIPLRAPQAAREALRAAAEAAEATVVDADRGLPRAGKLDLPERSLFLDHVHFTPEGHEAMAELLTPVIHQVLAR